MLHSGAVRRSYLVFSRLLGIHDPISYLLPEQAGTLPAAPVTGKLESGATLRAFMLWGTAGIRVLVLLGGAVA